ncbi:sulfite exporter TauE/SafE family protein [uncultured Shimia sp.]|uniref:sulfite exporter TauE/SafE family protein n=1 Tax=uncultured Shimia sp. TaxID=573152 RepID=UPI002620C4FB|nr:sulfite exporter TauE/SafE family protein [uncultured Shimia sp.]
MDSLLLIYSPQSLVICACVAMLAGVIKGMVGFGMPMVLISGLSTFLAPEVALAGLIFPTVFSNGFQAFRHGAGAAWSSLKRFRRFLLAGGLAMVISAQFVRWVPSSTLLLLIGVPVAFFALSQLLGRPVRLTKPSARGEVAVGTVAGAIGGVSGVWGPPTVTYLTAIGTEKREQIRIQGVIYGLGALLLVAAHLGSGVLNAATVGLSAFLVLPALLGMWIGTHISDQIDQKMFQRMTLFVLLLASLNLIRRAVF